MKKRYMMMLGFGLAFIGWHNASWRKMIAMEGIEIDVGESGGEEVEWPEGQSPEEIELSILEQELADRESGYEPTQEELVDAKIILQAHPDGAQEIINALQSALGTDGFGSVKQQLEAYYEAEAVLMNDKSLQETLAESLAKTFLPDTSETSVDDSDDQDDEAEEEGSFELLEELVPRLLESADVEEKTLNEIKLQALKDQYVVRKASDYDESYNKQLAMDYLSMSPDEVTLIKQIQDAAGTSDESSLLAEYYYYWFARATLLTSEALMDLIESVQKDVKNEEGSIFGN